MTIKHRREIDGLRAVAVLSVILFHAGFPLFSGGFVGVDVFFVISGYLITSLIITQLDAGKFSVVEFYERRARRILPALFFVVALCVPFAWIWLRPSDLASFGESMSAVAAYVSNVLFYHQTGYFSTDSDLKPLLHTWSLGVEEQYYLFFPLLVLVLWRLPRKWLVRALAGIALASFVIAEWAAVHRPEAAFFLLPMRAWEILLGALIALSPYSAARDDPGFAAGALSMLGLALIGYATFRYDAGPFPAIYALAPTVGTSLIIIFATPGTAVGKLLTMRPLVAIGLVSYSAYLWHQPIFAFARLQSLTDLGPVAMIALSVISLVLAAASWRWVEQPFRDRTNVARRHIFWGAAAGSIALMTTGFALTAKDGHPARFAPGVLQAIDPRPIEEDRFCVRKSSIGSGVSLCEFGDTSGASTVALYGDSHAGPIMAALDSAFRSRHIRGARILIPACPAIPGIIDSRFERTQIAECPAANARMLKWSRENADQMIVAIRWAYRLYPIPGAIDRLLFDNGEGGVERGDDPRTNYVLRKDGYHDVSGTAKAAAVNEFLSELADVSGRLVIIYPVPEPGWNVGRYNMRYYTRNASLPGSLSTPMTLFESRQRFVYSVLDNINAPNILRVKPADLLCNTFEKGRCALSVNGVPFYYDDDHLSTAGAKLVGQVILRDLLVRPA